MKKKTIEEQYQRKSQKEHILFRPDMYMGSIESQKMKMWVLSEDKLSIEEEEVEFIPGLYKIFDELLVNAGDNLQRDRRMTSIKIEITSSQASVFNNGKGLPIKKHQTEKMYVPELVFGHLLTSSNYDDTEKKVTGGRNGLGAKLTNIFSKKFSIETVDSLAAKKLSMTWTDNMSVSSEAKIESAQDQTDYTLVTFQPDFKRFGVKEFTKDMLRIMEKRVYDLAGILGGKVIVYLNKKKITVNSFDKYVELYLKGKGSIKIEHGARWAVTVALSDHQFRSVSFVNNINTHRGGTHVDYVTDQICEQLLVLAKKQKANRNITKQQLKQQLFVFVNCLVENPVFDSQTKESLKSNQSKFGSTIEIDQPQVFKDLVNWGIFDKALQLQKLKESSKMSKLNGKKSERILGIPKLEDANLAGTKQGHECTLILTEGDSAKCLAMSGVEILGRDRYGVFPLKGKLLNVRDVGVQQVTNNQELKNLISILGLKFRVNYKDCTSLRYGQVMIMTDQDTDGSHIKGLLINFLQHFWPSLLNIPQFLCQFITPLVKARHNNESHSFFTTIQFTQWLNEQSHPHLWKIKYYKGLGTSTHLEAREYFTNLRKHKVLFTYKSPQDDNQLDLVFNKTRADNRKQWINNYQQNPLSALDYSQPKMSISGFINQELILFSIQDNIRSLPNMMDGLKPCQRKVLFSCFKRRLVEEIKLSQLGGYVSENAAYHHGENSMFMTIIKLAQDYTGTNNIHLLEPVGQFGSRAQGGEDHASPRYIYTKLCGLSRVIFREQDDHILEYLVDEGQTVEPKYYLPIVPMLLINGACGTGTGWSTSVMQYDPLQIANVIRNRLIHGQWKEQTFLPYYQGFQGRTTLEPPSKDKEGVLNPHDQFVIHGLYQQTGPDTLDILELPLFKWTSPYKTFLESKLKTAKSEGDCYLTDIREEHCHNQVLFKLRFEEGRLAKLKQSGLKKALKLSINTRQSNMVMFNTKDQLKKFDDAYSILKQFYQDRFPYYSQRKAYLLSNLNREIHYLNNKINFIKQYQERTIDIHNSDVQQIVQQLIDKGFTKYQDLPKIKSNKGVNNDLERKVNDYDYLLSIQLMQLTKENVQKLKASLEKHEREFEAIEKKSESQMWIEDLDNFINAYEQFKSDIEKKYDTNLIQRIKKVKKEINQNKKLIMKEKNEEQKMEVEEIIPKTITKKTTKTKEESNLKKTETKEEPNLKKSKAKEEKIKSQPIAKKNEIIMNDSDDNFIDDSFDEEYESSSYNESEYKTKTNNKRRIQSNQKSNDNQTPIKQTSEFDQDIDEFAPKRRKRLVKMQSDDEEQYIIKQIKQESSVKQQESPLKQQESPLKQQDSTMKQEESPEKVKQVYTEEYVNSLPLRERMMLKKKLFLQGIEIFKKVQEEARNSINEEA